MFVPLTKEIVDNLAKFAKHQGEIVMGIYRLMPEFADCVQMKGYPKVSRVTSEYVYEVCKAYDKQNHPNSMAGGVWFNNGASVEEALPDWELHYTLDNFIMEEGQACRYQ